MMSRETVPERTCVSCGGVFGRPLTIGWTPLRAGWRCPGCSRAYTERVRRLAGKLVRSPGRAWVNTHTHTAADGCEACDVVAEASRIVLSAPEHHR